MKILSPQRTFQTNQNSFFASKRLRKSPRVHFRRRFASKMSPDLSGREFLCREVVAAFFSDRAREARRPSLPPGTGTQRQRFRRKMMPSQPFFHSTGAKTPAYATVGLSLEVKLFKQLLNTEFRLEQGLLDLYNICQIKKDERQMPPALSVFTTE